MSNGKFLIGMLSLVMLGVGWRQASAAVYVESQTFDTLGSATASGWAAQDTTPINNDNNYGWSNTTNAGGASGAGEAGGKFTRSSGENHYADTTIGGTYNRLTDGLFGNGRFNIGGLAPSGALGGIEIGFRSLDGSAGSDQSFLGMEIFDNAPNATFRVYASIEEANGTLHLGPAITVAAGAYDFSFNYAASTGTLTLVVPTQGTSTVTFAPAAGETFNGFGLGNYKLNNVNTQYADAFIDDVTYGVPEPTSLGLLGIGVLMCVRGRR